MALFGSLSYFIAQRTLWLGRANNAWGLSRVWNSGSSFESDSATWQGRANTAWGSSGVWNSGTPYSAQIPPATPDNITGTNIATSMNAGGSGPGQGNEICRLTINRTGNWSFAAYLQAGASGDGTTVWLSIMSGGATLGSNSFGFVANSGANSAGSGVIVDPVSLTSGAVVSLFAVKNGTQTIPTLTQQALRGYFMPTIANPS